MDIKKLLTTIDDIAKRNNISKPFIVGGVPRDRILGKRGTSINDIDITTGDNNAAKLGELLNKAFTDSKYRTYDDGHSSINTRGIRIDFSSNFILPNIDAEMRKVGVTDADTMKRELYSRDFTMNTLLEDLNLDNIYDLTGEAVNDINAGLIKCPIDPDITIGVDPRRILRAIKFSLKFGFKIDDKLKNVMLKRRKSIQTLSERFVQDRMNEIVRVDADKGIDMLIEYKLLPLVQLSKTISDMLIQRRQLARAF